MKMQLVYERFLEGIMENEGNVLERGKADRVQKVQKVLPASSGRVQREGEMKNEEWRMVVAHFVHAQRT